MKTFYKLAIFALLISSCGKIENSSSLDDVLYGDFTETGSADYLATKTSLNSYCIQCHAAWRTYSEQNFIDAGLVVPGDPASSKLYYRNANATSGAGPKNMPTSGYPPIPSSDLDVIANWISAL